MKKTFFDPYKFLDVDRDSDKEELIVAIKDRENHLFDDCETINDALRELHGFTLACTISYWEHARQIYDQHCNDENWDGNVFLGSSIVSFFDYTSLSLALLDTLQKQDREQFSALCLEFDIIKGFGVEDYSDFLISGYYQDKNLLLTAVFFKSQGTMRGYYCDDDRRVFNIDSHVEECIGIADMMNDNESEKADGVEEYISALIHYAYKEGALDDINKEWLSRPLRDVMRNNSELKKVRAVIIQANDKALSENIAKVLAGNFERFKKQGYSEGREDSIVALARDVLFAMLQPHGLYSGNKEFKYAALSFARQFPGIKECDMLENFITNKGKRIELVKPVKRLTLANVFSRLVGRDVVINRSINNNDTVAITNEEDYLPLYSGRKYPNEFDISNPRALRYFQSAHRSLVRLQVIQSSGTEDEFCKVLQLDDIFTAYETLCDSVYERDCSHISIPALQRLSLKLDITANMAKDNGHMAGKNHRDDIIDVRTDLLTILSGLVKSSNQAHRQALSTTLWALSNGS